MAGNLSGAVTPFEQSTTSDLRRAAKSEPARRPHPYVARHRLEELLDTCVQSSVTLVCGPAGAGKSVLLSAWLSSRAEKRAWITLDERDNDPATFWAGIAHALEHLLGRTPRASTSLTRKPSPGSVLKLLREASSVTADRCFLALDNAQVLIGRGEHDLLNELVDVLPPSIHLLIGSRSQPDISLHRLRVAGNALEINARDLRFTLAETMQLLVQAEVGDLDPARLIARSDGWAAGIVILATSGGSDEEAMRAVHDFLFAEAFEKLPADLQQFLMESACLEYVSAALCGQITGRDDAADVLRRLEHDNAFISGVEGEFGRYRYHPQFRLMLRNELHARDPGRAHAVFAVGARWCEQQNHLGEAIEQYLDAGQEHDALRLLSEANVRYGDTRPDLLRGWVSRINTLSAHEDPTMLLDLAGSLALAQDNERSRAVLDRVEGILQMTPDVASEVHAAMLRARLAVGAADVESEAAWLRQAQARLHSDPRLTHDLLLVGVPRSRGIQAWLALDQLWLDQLVDARTTLSSRPYKHLEDRIDLLHVWGVAAAISFTEGYLDDAQALALQSRRAADELGIVGYKAWPAALALAATMHERDDTAGALRRYEELIRFTRDPVGNTFSVAAQVGLATVLRTRGDTTSALEVLSGVRRNDPTGPRSATQSWVARATSLTLLRLGQTRAAREALGPPPYRPSEMPAAVFVELAAGQLDDASRLCASMRRENPREVLFGALVDAQVAVRRGNDGAAIVYADEALQVARSHGFVRSVLDFGSELLSLFPSTPTGAGDPEFVERLRRADGVAPAASSEGGYPEGFDELTAREFEVLRYLPTQLSVRDIAHALYVSPNTVKSHMQHLYRKLRVDSREAAVALARTLQLLR